MFEPLHAALQFICALCILIILSSCGPSAPDAPDVSHLDVSVKVRRFERDLMQLDTASLDSSLARLEAAYPAFAPLFFSNMLPIRRGDLSPEEQALVLKSFLSDTAFQQLFQTVDRAFPDLADQTNDLEQALRYFRYYFPEAAVPPSFTTFISGFQYGALLYGENDLAAGLEFFLGSGYPYSSIDPSNPIFSRYLSRTYTPEHLTSKLMRGLVNDLVGEPSGQRMIDLMINNGKKLFILDQLMPYTPDSILMEVSSDQYDWLEENEFNLWAFFLEEDLLYSTSYKDFRKYVDVSPNSPGMPPEAPGRTANWIGWQIVKAYQRRQPEATLEDIAAAKDAQRLLEQSRYKPRG